MGTSADAAATSQPWVGLRSAARREASIVAGFASRQHGQALEVQRLAQLFERRHPPQLPALGVGRCGYERVLRVLRGQLRKPSLVAPEGGPDFDARATPLREDLLQGCRSPDLLRDDDLGRDTGRDAVVAKAELLDDRLEVLAGDVLELEAVAVDEPPVPQREDLHRCTVAVNREPDHVDRLGPALRCGLALGEMTHGEEPVAIPGGVFETLLGSRDRHLALELGGDRLRVSREEVDHAVDDPAVLLRRDLAHARGETAVDVVVEAGDPRVPAWTRPLTRAKAEGAVEHVERLAHLLRVRIRAEVHDAAAVPLAREHHARVLVLERYRDVRERLVVAKADVEGRPMTLDEALLEVERLSLGARDDRLHVGDSLDELNRAEPRVAGPLEVAADA